VGETPVFVVAADASNARVAAPAPVELAIAEELESAEATVYPNPSSDFVSIDLANSLTGQVEIRIFDAQSGRLHKNERIHKTGHRFLHKVNITQWPTSTYIVEIRQGNEFAYRKIAKL
jgi:endoglucanase